MRIQVQLEPVFRILDCLPVGGRTVFGSGVPFSHNVSQAVSVSFVVSKVR